MLFDVANQLLMVLEVTRHPSLHDIAFILNPIANTVMLSSDLTITAHVDCLTLCAKRWCLNGATVQILLNAIKSMHHACIKSGMLIVYTLLKCMHEKSMSPWVQEDDVNQTININLNEKKKNELIGFINKFIFGMNISTLYWCKIFWNLCVTCATKAEW